MEKDETVRLIDPLAGKVTTLQFLCFMLVSKLRAIKLVKANYILVEGE